MYHRQIVGELYCYVAAVLTSASLQNNFSVLATLNTAFVFRFVTDDE